MGNGSEMKRDMALVREILLKVEALPFHGRFHDVEIKGHSDEDINYHIMLLDEAGFIEAEDLTNTSGVCWKPKRLTYHGHESLDAARSDTAESESCGAEEYRNVDP